MLPPTSVRVISLIAILTLPLVMSDVARVVSSALQSTIMRHCVPAPGPCRVPALSCVLQQHWVQLAHLHSLDWGCQPLCHPGCQHSSSSDSLNSNTSGRHIVRGHLPHNLKTGQLMWQEATTPIGCWTTPAVPPHLVLMHCQQLPPLQPPLHRLLPPSWTCAASWAWVPHQSRLQQRCTASPADSCTHGSALSHCSIQGTEA